MEELPPEYSRPASAYLDIARVQEQNGLFADRDSMLRIAAAKDAALGARLSPIFDGRAHTIAEAESMIAMTAARPATER